MATLVLIPWAETAWSAAGRIAGRTPLPLTEEGKLQAESWAEVIAPHAIKQVYSSDERASVETAEIIARKLGATHKTMMDVAEVDPGLWDGLTLEELKRRHAKVFKRWYNDPSSVCPPEGEDLRDASTRISRSIEKIVRKNGAPSTAVVLGPVAFAVIRCRLEGNDLAEVHRMRPDGPLHYDQHALVETVDTTASRYANGSEHSPSAPKSDD